MDKKLIVIFIGLAVLLGGGMAETKELKTDFQTAKAQNQVKPSSSNDRDVEQKKTAIMKIMSQGTFETYIQENKKFCSAFLEDFKQQKNITHVQPVVEADSYNDPKLQTYFKSCQGKAFNKTYVIYHPSMMAEATKAEDEARAEGKELSDEDWEELGGVPYIATKNFKLYKVNIDNNMKNGDEYVLYAEGYYNEESGLYFYGGYTIVDVKKCTTDGGTNTNDPYDYKKNIPLDNHNGIVRYKGRCYVFDLGEGHGYRLILKGYNRRYKNMETVCKY